MLKLKHYFFFLSLILFVNPSLHANDIYDPIACTGGKPLKNALIALKLSPTIKYNGDLLAEVQMQYGKDLVESMIDYHPNLRRPDKAIDIKTIHWVLERFFLTQENQARRVYFSPFSKMNDKSIQEMVASIISESFPKITSIPVFFDEYKFKTIRTMFNKDNFNVSTGYIMSIYGTDRATSLLMAKAIYNQIFEKGKYVIGIENIKKNTRIISIIGHGHPGNPYINQNKLILHFSDVASLLKEADIPKDITISIDICNGSCGDLPRNFSTSLSREELIQAFLEGKIKNHIGENRKSFGFMFSKVLFSIIPDFRGNIITYNGSLSFMPLSVLSIDKDNPTITKQKITFGVSLLTKDYKETWFDRSFMQYVYTRSMFIP